MATIKIKPSHPSQGEYVLIEEENFDPAIHQKLDEVKVEEIKPEVKRGRPAKGE